MDIGCEMHLVPILQIIINIIGNAPAVITQFDCIHVVCVCGLSLNLLLSLSLSQLVCLSATKQANHSTGVICRLYMSFIVQCALDDGT